MAWSRGRVGAGRVFEAEDGESYWTSSRRSSVSSKSCSVSPGKPTMMSVVMAMARRAPFIHEMRSQVFDRGCTGAAWRRARGRNRTARAGGRGCRGSGLASIASTIRFDEVARVGGGEAHAADAGDFADAARSCGEVPPGGGRGVAIAVDVLAEELDFGNSRRRRSGAPLRARWRWCGCARVRG